MSSDRSSTNLLAPGIRAWRGEASLWKVFWIYGFATSCVLVGLYISAITSGYLAAQQALLIGYAAYSVWIVVSIWRCANAAQPWGLLARWLVVPWVGNVILVLTFLELDLVTAYLSP